MRISQPNRLLAGLPDGDRLRLLGACDEVSLEVAAVLYTSGGPLEHAYFPTGSSVSLMIAIDAVDSLEVSLVGSEGMLGIPLVLGVSVSPMRAVVQGPGPALRMEASLFRRELERSRALQAALNRYVCVQWNQLAQSALCTRYHVVEARLARWLLMTQDRARADHFHITHEFLAVILGVRRVGVTKAASALQRRSLIRYSRGDITVLDRRGLRAASCGCYEADRKSYSSILPVA
ncbi:MAG: Crp/Fnr family transcriptional regulator [Casimicrobiaceae bacterium]